MQSLYARNADEIARRYPQVARNVAGYNINRLGRADPNLADLLVGSEGTLAWFQELELALQPITTADIVKNSAMEGAGCSFTPGGEEDPFAILADGVGFVKYEGSIQRLAADAGSKEGPFGTREQYDGREYSLNITIDQSKKEGASETSWAAPATVTMEDGYDREVAMSEGRVACGG